MKKKLIIGTFVILIIVVCMSVIVYFAFPLKMLTFFSNLERGAAGLTEKSIQVGTHTIKYLEGGKGQNILLIHGYSGDKDNWTRFSKYLTPEYHVVAIDLPGFGQSSKIEPETYGISDQVKRVDAFVTAVRLGKFHLAGNSMGGAISGRYASAYPDKVLSVGFFNTGGVTCPEKSKFHHLLEKEGNILLVDSPEDFDGVMKFVFVKPPWIPRPIKNYLAEQAMVSRDFNEKIMKDLSAEMYDMTEDLPKIMAKTLILWGDTDRVIDVSCVKPLQKGLPNSTIVIMKACGHCPNIERPEEAAGHYSAFIRGKETSGAAEQ